MGRVGFAHCPMKKAHKEVLNGERGREAESTGKEREVKDAKLVGDLEIPNAAI